MIDSDHSSDQHMKFLHVAVAIYNTDNFYRPSFPHGFHIASNENTIFIPHIIPPSSDSNQQIPQPYTTERTLLSISSILIYTLFMGIVRYEMYLLKYRCASLTTPLICLLPYLSIKGVNLLEGLNQLRTFKGW